jgi:hypothetical protein
MIRRALAASLSRIAEALDPSRTTLAQQEDRAVRKLLEVQLGVLAGSLAAADSRADRAEARVAELEDLIERMRDDAGPVYESEQQLRDRVRDLEAEREWKPWPPEVRDGRDILVRSDFEGLFLTRAEHGGNTTWHFCEIPAYVPPKRNDHA